MGLFGRKNYSTVNVKKRDIPNGLWLKCPACNEIIYKKTLESNLNICPKCDHHFPLKRQERIEQLLEKNSFLEWDETLASADPLEFTGVDSYTSKLEQNMKKTGYRDAVTCGRGRMGSHEVGFGVMDFSFLGASMGSVVGEKITRLYEKSIEQRLPVVLVCASGGARMYEGMFSLMQMAKTSGAIARLKQAGLAYIPVLTHPTTAGVMASFATLGDVIVAEPKALIGFAGPRVIKETTQQDLPQGFQRSEFLLQRGLIDRVAHRRDLKDELIRLLDFMTASRREQGAA
jgi:acetyl-CoA carboxylase carboxyl transferase subunit beta